MSLITALCSSGISLFVNQGAQFFDIEDGRRTTQEGKSPACFTKAIVLGLMGGGFLSTGAYLGARTITAIVPSLETPSTVVYCLASSGIGLAGIRFKIDQMTYIWKNHSIGLSNKEKIIRAAIDGGAFVATGVITTAVSLFVE